MRVVIYIFLLGFLFTTLYASNVTMTGRDDTGVGCGTGDDECPIVFQRDNVTEIWSNASVVGTSTGAPIEFIRMVFSPLNQKRIIVAENSNGEIDTYVSWDGTTWTQTRNYSDVWITDPSTFFQGFDIAFETQSGDALLMYSNHSIGTGTCEILYAIILANETAPGSSGCIDDTGTTGSAYSWIAADADPVSTSDEIIVAGFDGDANDINAWVWSGTSWGNEVEIENKATATNGFEALAVHYSADGTDGMVISAAGTKGELEGQLWSGSSWTNSDPGDVSSGQDDVQWIIMDADPSTDDLMVISVTSDSGMSSSYWNGASWSNTVDIDSSIDSGAFSVRSATFVWNLSNSIGWLLWDTDSFGGATLSNRTFSGGSWGSTVITPTDFSGTGGGFESAHNPSAGESVNVLFSRQQDDDDIDFINLTDSNGYARFVKTNRGYAGGMVNTVAFIIVSDTTGPTVANTSVNSTSVNTDELICVNATAFDQNSAPIDAVWAEVTFPDGSISNETLTNNGCNSGTITDTWYGVSINVSSTGGTFVINTTFANDSFGNIANESAIVNITINSTAALVDTTISVSTLTFGSLDPSTSDNAASENPITLTNTNNSNTAIDVYLNNTNMTSGSNVINGSNLSVWTADSASLAVNYNISLTFLNGTGANQGFIENLAKGSIVDFYHYHDVPVGQAAADYTSVVLIRSVADGEAP